MRRVLAVAVIVAALIACDPWGHAPRALAHPPITSTGLVPIGSVGIYGPIP
jgi:hypothetical protein